MDSSPRIIRNVVHVESPSSWKDLIYPFAIISLIVLVYSLSFSTTLYLLAQTSLSDRTVAIIMWLLFLVLPYAIIYIC